MRGVKRVVLTSSFAAIGYGKLPPDGRPFTEENWTDPAGKVSAYVKSKTLAERAAWDFIAAEGGKLELAVVNPVGIFGPVLGADHSTSTEFVQRMLNGAMPGLPRLSFGVVDARDVADLHVRAMTNPAARGERFLAVAGDFMTVREIAQTLKTRLGDAGARVSTRELPDWLVRIVGLFNPEVAQLVTGTGQGQECDQSEGRARARLGAAITRRRAGCHRRKPDPARAAQKGEVARREAGIRLPAAQSSTGQSGLVGLQELLQRHRFAAGEFFDGVRHHAKAAACAWWRRRTPEAWRRAQAGRLPSCPRSGRRRKAGRPGSACR